MLTETSQALTSREQNVYEWLSDKKSKEIFFACKQFSEKWNVPHGNNELITDVKHAQLWFDAAFEQFFEPLPDLPCTSIKDALVKMASSRFIICGYGFTGKATADTAANMGFIDNLVAVWEIDPAMLGTTVYNTKIELQPKTLAETPSFDFCIVASGVNILVPKIVAGLRKLGIPEEKILCPFICNEKEQYFASDIIIPRLIDNEVFIDGGCLDFSTSERLLEVNRNVSKIYAFEPDRHHYEACKSRIEKSGFDKAVTECAAWWSKDTVLKFSNGIGGSAILDEGTLEVKARSIDSVVPNDEIVTYIKLDIEGAELEALKGASKTIKRCKPKIAVAIYHRPFDYIEITEFIKALVPEYKAYFRHYCGAAIETDLYCVI